MWQQIPQPDYWTPLVFLIIGFVTGWEAHNSWKHRNDQPDWRDKAFYPTDKPCCVCGSTERIGEEPRFGYPVCKEHSKLSPVEINDQRTDGR